jgi:hypothetical protein
MALERSPKSIATKNRILKHGMSQPTTYEQLIAQKLQELAVPDQADAIWATIEQQLNIEMPNSSSGSGGLNNSNWWIGGGSLFTLLVAIATYIYVSKQDLESEKPIKEKPAAIQHHQPLKNNEDMSSHKLSPIEIRQNKPTTAPEANGQEVEETEPSSVKETVESAPVQNVAAPAVLPLPPDTVVAKKKPRGVKGISSEDYRIVPSKKDIEKPKN